MSTAIGTTRPLLLLAATLLSGVLLTGCAVQVGPEPTGSPEPTETATETPEPDPTRPPLADLVLAPDGLDGLAIGDPAPTDPATSLATYDPAACDGYGLWTADPAYAAATSYGPPTAFGVGGAGTVDRIELYSDDIPTDQGIRLGATRADVEAAYPGVAPVAEYLTDLYIVAGTTGALVIEVTAQDAAYWESSGIALDTVQYIRAMPTGTEAYSVAASGNAVGVCLS